MGTFKKKYNDTLNFAVREAAGGGATIRIFSISDIQGALGDMGQNRRTVSMLGEDLNLGTMTVLFGCGSYPSLPTSPPAALTMSAKPLDRMSMPVWIDRALFAAIGAALAFVLL